jgi:GNAT superfamily N-acetyltransferase
MQIASLIDHVDQLPRLAKLHHDEWSQVSRFRTFEEHLRKLETRMSHRPIPATYILFIDSVVAGSVSLIDHDDLDNVRPDLSPWLASLYVEPGHRRQGYGSALVRYCLLQAGKALCPRLYLYTDTHSQFYVRFGWQPIETRISRGVDITIMELKITL